MTNRPARGGKEEERALTPGSTRTPSSDHSRMIRVGSGGDETPGPPRFKLDGELRMEELRGMRAMAQTVGSALAAESEGEGPPPKEEAREAMGAGSSGGGGRGAGTSAGEEKEDAKPRRSERARETRSAAEGTGEHGEAGGAGGQGARGDAPGWRDILNAAPAGGGSGGSQSSGSSSSSSEEGGVPSSVGSEESQTPLEIEVETLRTQLEDVTARVLEMEEEGRVRDAVRAAEDRERETALNQVIATLVQRLDVAETVAAKASKTAAKATKAAMSAAVPPKRTTAGLSTRDYERVVAEAGRRVDLSGYAKASGVVTLAELNNPAPGTELFGIYALKDVVADHERLLKDPAGSVAGHETRIVHLESKRQANACEFGGVTFKDAQATDAWFHLLKDKEANALAPDMVTLLATSGLAAVTIAAGLKGAADTIRAGFGSTLAGETEMSFQTPYPETI